MALVEGDWQVKRIFHPGKTIIAAARPGGKEKWHAILGRRLTWNHPTAKDDTSRPDREGVSVV